MVVVGLFDDIRGLRPLVNSGTPDEILPCYRDWKDVDEAGVKNSAK